MSYQLPPLTNADEFETLIRDIARQVHNDPGIEKFGRRGQEQSGIDGLSPANSTITFQCKLKDTRYASDDQLRKTLLSEMEAEFAKTAGLAQPLTRFIFASTFKNDRDLQEKAASLSAPPTTIEYWGWDTINEKIWEFADDLIPTYYPWCPIRSVIGFRKITPRLIKDSRTSNQEELNRLALDYYRINDRSEIVFKIVCNNLDVRNQQVMENVYRRLNDLPFSGTLWLLGDGGSGKTTILHRAALELAERHSTVFMLDLEAPIGAAELQWILSRLNFCSSTEPVVLCIDNPAANEEVLEALLRQIPNYAENIHIIFSERGHRYHALRRTDSLTYLHGEEDSKPLYVSNNRNQREDVYNRLFELVGLSEADKEPLLHIIRNERLVYVNATYTILLELKKQRKIDFDFDWDDYRKVTANLGTLSEGYKYIALFYLFGVRTPFSTLSRVLGASDAQQVLFLERFRGFVNEPIVVDEQCDDSFRKITHLRTKHEIVSEIFFREHPKIDKNDLLMTWAGHIEFDDLVEAQALINVFGAKKNYLAETPQLDFAKIIEFLSRGYLNNKISRSTKLTGALALAQFWLSIQNNPERRSRS